MRFLSPKKFVRAQVNIFGCVKAKLEKKIFCVVVSKKRLVVMLFLNCTVQGIKLS
jgi:hypothetical protein